MTLWVRGGGTGMWGRVQSGGASPRRTQHCVSLGFWFLAAGGERQGPRAIVVSALHRGAEQRGHRGLELQAVHEQN